MPRPERGCLSGPGRVFEPAALRGARREAAARPDGRGRAPGGEVPGGGSRGASEGCSAAAPRGAWVERSGALTESVCVVARASHGPALPTGAAAACRRAPLGLAKLRCREIRRSRRALGRRCARRAAERRPRGRGRTAERRPRDAAARADADPVDAAARRRGAVLVRARSPPNPPSAWTLRALRKLVLFRGRGARATPTPWTRPRRPPDNPRRRFGPRGRPERRPDGGGRPEGASRRRRRGRPEGAARAQRRRRASEGAACAQSLRERAAAAGARGRRRSPKTPAKLPNPAVTPPAEDGAGALEPKGDADADAAAGAVAAPNAASPRRRRRRAESAETGRLRGRRERAGRERTRRRRRRRAGAPAPLPAFSRSSFSASCALAYPAFAAPRTPS